MKFRRFLSGLVFGIGCALIFIGILSAVLPSVPNLQLQLVLGSFALSSENILIRLINRAMSYALAHSWRVLLLGVLSAGAGAFLLLHFTPKKLLPSAVPKERPLPSAPFPVLEAEDAAIPQLPNPFAVGTYLDHLPLRESKAEHSFIRHAAPILELNKIEDSPMPEVSPVPAALPDRDVPNAEPFFSPHFEDESRAIESERGLPSQSGSRILIRSAFEQVTVRERYESPKEEPAAVPLMEERTAPPAAQLSASASMPPFSPRIRSTMGKKSRR